MTMRVLVESMCAIVHARARVFVSAHASACGSACDESVWVHECESGTYLRGHDFMGHPGQNFIILHHKAQVSGGSLSILSHSHSEANGGHLSPVVQDKRVRVGASLPLADTLACMHEIA